MSCVSVLKENSSSCNVLMMKKEMHGWNHYKLAQASPWHWKIAICQSILHYPDGGEVGIRQHPSHVRDRPCSEIRWATVPCLCKPCNPPPLFPPPMISTLPIERQVTPPSAHPTMAAVTTTRLTIPIQMPRPH